jgi:NAD(P)-dependent dehydrogenase (short-subunit alcohol dehydrogenase family)
MSFKGKNYWALILGGSSGFGLATAKKLSSLGMNICVVHRDRKGSMERIEPEFETIRKTGAKLVTFNLDGLSAEGRQTVLDQLTPQMEGGKVRLMLHSIAFGSLKLIAPLPANAQQNQTTALAAKLGVDAATVQKAVDELFDEGQSALTNVATPPKFNSEFLLSDEELATTIYAMGTSLCTWTQELFKRKLFAADARVLGLTSEGNETAWFGYAAVSAAKAALEAVSRSIAREFAPYGVRSNIVQPGVTDTPALRLIPGNAQLSAHAELKNPFGRLTQVEDVANVISLLATDEAAWINGTIIRVDGGERISG